MVIDEDKIWMTHDSFSCTFLLLTVFVFVFVLAGGGLLVVKFIQLFQFREILIT